MEYLPSRTERRLKWFLIILAVILISSLAILYLLPGFRLSLGQTLRIVPGRDAEQVVPAGEARLIVISSEVDAQLSQGRFRHEARYIVRDAMPPLVTDLRTGVEFSLPLDSYDDVLISSDRTRLLFTQDGGSSAILTLADNQVEPVAGQPAGDWLDDVFSRERLCSGSSPSDQYALCIRTGSAGFRYVIGDWEIQVRPFGSSDSWQRVYRGRGLVPIAGFSPDETSVYLQNELGIWRAPIEE